MNTTVTGCDDCPFYNAYYGGETISGKADTGYDCCNHPFAPVDENGDMLIIQHENYETITPDWCPLKKEEITIKLIG